MWSIVTLCRMTFRIIIWIIYKYPKDTCEEIWPASYWNSCNVPFPRCYITYCMLSELFNTVIPICVSYKIQKKKITIVQCSLYWRELTHIRGKQLYCFETGKRQLLYRQCRKFGRFHYFFSQVFFSVFSVCWYFAGCCELQLQELGTVRFIAVIRQTLFNNRFRKRFTCSVWAQ